MTRGTWVGTRIWKRDMALYEKSLVLVCCRRTSFIPFPLPLPPQQCIGTSGRKRLLRAREMLIATLGSSCDEDIMNLSHTAKHYLSEAPRSASTTVILPSPFLFFYVRFYNWLASILPWWFIPCRTMMFFLLWCDSYSEWAFGQLLLYIRVAVWFRVEVHLNEGRQLIIISDAHPISTCRRPVNRCLSPTWVNFSICLHTHVYWIFLVWVEKRK